LAACSTLAAQRDVRERNGGPSSNVVQFSKDQIAVRDEPRLRAEECFQDCAGQSCVMPMMLKDFNALFLVTHILLATQQMALSLF
jgi:hypothetical protein